MTALYLHERRLRSIVARTHPEMADTLRAAGYQVVAPPKVNTDRMYLVIVHLRGIESRSLHVWVDGTAAEAVEMLSHMVSTHPNWIAGAIHDRADRTGAIIHRAEKAP